MQALLAQHMHEADERAKAAQPHNAKAADAFARLRSARAAQGIASNRPRHAQKSVERLVKQLEEANVKQDEAAQQLAKGDEEFKQAKVANFST